MVFSFPFMISFFRSRAELLRSRADGTAHRHYSLKLFIRLYPIDQCLWLILIVKFFFSAHGPYSLPILVKFAIRSGKSTTLDLRMDVGMDGRMDFRMDGRMDAKMDVRINEL